MMRASHGFTLLELAVAVAVASVLATLGYAGYQSAWEKSNFRNMQEFGIELAMSQQLHRQRFGQYARQVAATGTPSTDLLVMPLADQFHVTVQDSDFRRFSAIVTPHATDLRRLPSECSVLIVESDMGLQRLYSRSSSNQDTSARCIPHG